MRDNLSKCYVSSSLTDRLLQLGVSVSDIYKQPPEAKSRQQPKLPFHKHKDAAEAAEEPECAEAAAEDAEEAAEDAEEAAEEPPPKRTKKAKAKAKAKPTNDADTSSESDS